MNSSNSAAKAAMGKLCTISNRFVLTFFFLSLASGTVLGQHSWPIQFTLSESSPGEGDTLELDVDMGTSTQVVQAASSHTITYTYDFDGLDVDPNSPFEVDDANSFLLDENWAKTISVDTESNEIVITFTRTDSQLFPEGYGQAFVLKGIIITIEDVTMRQGYIGSATKSEVAIFPNPCDNKLTVQSQTLFQQIEIIDQLGRRVYLWTGESQSHYVPTNNFKAGMYFVKTRENRGIESQNRLMVTH